MDDSQLSHSSRGLHEDQGEGRERPLEFVILIYLRVFGTGEAAAVAVEIEKHKRLGCGL